MMKTGVRMSGGELPFRPFFMNLSSVQFEFPFSEHIQINIWPYVIIS